MANRIGQSTDVIDAAAGVNLARWRAANWRVRGPER